MWSPNPVGSIIRRGREGDLSLFLSLCTCTKERPCEHQWDSSGLQARRRGLNEICLASIGSSCCFLTLEGSPTLLICCSATNYCQTWQLKTTNKHLASHNFCGLGIGMVYLTHDVSQCAVVWSFTQGWVSFKLTHLDVGSIQALVDCLTESPSSLLAVG